MKTLAERRSGEPGTKENRRPGVKKGDNVEKITTPGKGCKGYGARRREDWTQEISHQGIG